MYVYIVFEYGLVLIDVVGDFKQLAGDLAGFFEEHCGKVGGIIENV
jgi:hypothetical protein